MPLNSVAFDDVFVAYERRAITAGARRAVRHATEYRRCLVVVKLGHHEFFYVLVARRPGDHMPPGCDPFGLCEVSSEDLQF